MLKSVPLGYDDTRQHRPNIPVPARFILQETLPVSVRRLRVDDIDYKRISSTDNDSQIKEIKHELMDRFGTVPEFTSNLLEVTKLKNKANSIGIKRIKLNNQYGRIYFHSSTTIESDLLIQLIKENHDKFRLYPDQSLGFKGDFLVSIEKIKEIKELLNYLTSGQAPKSTH